MFVWHSPSHGFPIANCGIQCTSKGKGTVGISLRLTLVAEKNDGSRESKMKLD